MRPSLEPSVVRIAVLSLALAGTSAVVAAQPFPRRDLPPVLQPWVPWVLDEVPDLGCIRVQGRAVCLWPGRLQLDLGATGGTFGLELQAERPTDVPLPGSREHWPQDVRLDGAPAPVVERGGHPVLRVGAGSHRLSGRFSWVRLPESLGVPAEIGLVSLRLDGQAVARPRREAGGLLWLRSRTEAAGEGESLRVQVFRRIADGIPVFVETRVVLEVSGPAREATLKGALLPHSVPVAVSGDLPARLESGALRVQLRAGRFSVSVDARLEGRPEAVDLPKGAAPAPWPGREVWVFAADEALRQVELSGPTPIDPSRTDLPGEWRSLPAFLVEPGGELAFAVVRRGEAEPPPDAITLARELWLDPDGRGASVRDSFGGTLRSTTRLDLRPPGTLGRVAVDGQDQLVTADPETGASGVELRRSALHLEADSRLDLRGRVPAVGWTTGVEDLRGTLHVPPGWSLLAAAGVDRVPGTWVSRWTLLGFFFVLVVALAAYRLFGVRAGVLALATLVLTYGEAGAPFAVWLSLVAAIALGRVAPPGRLSRLAHLWFLASVAVLVVVAVPFVRDQLKGALFPQVAEEGAGGRFAGLAAAKAPPARENRVRSRAPVGGTAGAAPEAVPAAPPPQAPDELQADRAMPSRAERTFEAPVERLAKKSAGWATNVALEQDPKAVLQTGPGVPDWTWRTYVLTWSGPVGRDHTLRLFLASPGLSRFLTLLRLLLLAILAFLLLTGRWPRLPRRREPMPILLLLAVVLLPGASARAAQGDEPESPGPALLQELKQRLTRPAPCEPDCVATPSLLLRLTGERLTITAQVDAAADGAWAVPGPVATWAPAEILVDGRTAPAVVRFASGFLEVRLPRGVHRVEAVGPVPPGDAFTLQFAHPPLRARAETPGWDVSGLRAEGPAEPSILLSRRLPAAGRAASAEGQYPPWLEVRRTLGFGVTWTVETRVRRVTPLGTPVSLRVPLLAGEAPTRPDLVVEKREAVVSLGGDETETGWQSTLEQAPEIVLRAPEGEAWSEVWSLQCSTIWSCTASGLPPTARLEDGVFAPEFHPWPGEALTVALRHPQGVEGQTLTIDGLTLESTPGRRLERVRLTATARASREQPLVLRLPKEAEVQQVSVDGQDRPSRPEGGELRLTVPAGRHAIEVRWQQARGMGAFHGLPRVGLGGPAVNVTQQVTLPPERWLLLTWGPSWGPAVLFWPYLVFVVVVALVLGRLPGSALTSTQWVLLGLGLSVLPALAALVVAAFVFALALRARRAPAGRLAFDGLQLVLAAWALVSLGLLYVAIHQGLLLRPQMQVAGGGSSDALLRWYADRVAGDLPAAGVLSLPLWVYRVAMLLWALWLAAGLVRAVGPAWRAFGEGGFWRPLRRPRPATTEPAAATEPPAEGPPKDDAPVS